MWWCGMGVEARMGVRVVLLEEEEDEEEEEEMAEEEVFTDEVLRRA
jgi:hypothetical protein